MGACLVTSIALGGWWLVQAQGLRRLRSKLGSERRALHALEAEVRAGVDETAEQTADTEDLQRWRRAFLSTLTRGEVEVATPASVPQSATEACGLLAAMAQRLRTRAAAHSVALADGESFGFTAFAQAGPDPAQVTAVHQQSLAIEEAVSLLIDAEPSAIVAVRREAVPAGSGIGGPGGATMLEAGNAEIFQMALGRSWRVEGVVGSTAVEIQFVGQTQVLRTFLTSVATSAPLLAVRGVACGPADGAIPRRRDAADTPWLQPQPLKFTVCLERAWPTTASDAVHAGEELSDLPADMETATAAPWRSPDVARMNDCRADLFTSPVVVHDQVSGQFRVTRWGEAAEPLARRDERSAPAADVPPRPFRVQLLGYVGTGGDALGTFADVESGQTFLARSGETVSAAAIKVHAIRRILRTLQPEAKSGLSAWITEAEIEDLRAGRRVTLTDAAPSGAEVGS